MTASRGFAPPERLQMPVEPALRNRQKPTPPPVTRSGARDAAHAARITAAVIAVMAVAVGLWFSRTAILVYGASKALAELTKLPRLAMLAVVVLVTALFFVLVFSTAGPTLTQQIAQLAHA